MSDSWDDRRRAQEDAYFEKQNEEALKRLKQREGVRVRRSPITGEPMEQLTVMGVNVDRCPSSGGIWLDSGELEQIIKAAKAQGENKDWVADFFQGIFGRKS